MAMDSLLILTGLAGMVVVKFMLDLCKTQELHNTETQQIDHPEIPPKYQEFENPPNYDSI